MFDRMKLRNKNILIGPEPIKILKNCKLLLKLRMKSCLFYLIYKVNYFNNLIQTNIHNPKMEHEKGELINVIQLNTDSYFDFKDI
jgi:hypothetical protein